MALRSLVIDATTAEHARGGIGVVTAGFLEALAAQPRALEVTVLAGPTTPVPDGLRTIRIPFLGRSAARIGFQRLVEPAFIRLAGGELARADRLLTLDSYVPAWKWPGQFPEVASFVHDVLPLTHPQFFTSRKDVAKRLAFRSISSQRPLVFTSTDFTAREIRSTLGVDPRVARFGCGQLTDKEADSFLRLPARHRRPFILYVGAVEERKDLKTLVRAFGDIRRSGHEGLQLAIAGNWNTGEGRNFRRWSATHSDGGVRFLGRVEREQARYLLENARALVYPSVAEGFGLPVIEGFAVGTPVVASNIEAITSWAGDAARFFTPGDAGSLAAALREAIEQPIETTAQRGKELAESYRWKSFASAMVA
jgi:glycosyltransferase involved in cell wall biosynthesis